jgi:lipopolysaccharide transport system permease protein/teichoic acid transport system permease protein
MLEILNKIAHREKDWRRYLSIKEFFEFLRDLYWKRKIIKSLVIKDFRNQFLGSYLGIFWAFFQPAVFVFVLWFIFSSGFRVGLTMDIPFVLYLMSGIVVWTFFSEGFVAGTMAVLVNSYLVKKVSFRVSILPVVKILSHFLVHLIFFGLLLIVSIGHRKYPGIHSIQTVYYMFATIVLLIGLSWISSALHVFVRDVGQVTRVISRLGFWFTPVFWELDMLPPKTHFFLKLNPVYYLVTGYRDSLYYNVWFWENLRLTIYFWMLTMLLFSVGAIAFRRLRPHFADVL